ncbi:MAG: nicotinate (nicotinamide) nucleotide adenylyltransferase [Saccharofermentanales bacterium]
METNKLQKLINDTYKDNFGYTPLSERLNDIQKEFFELMKWSDIHNLKEETGDLLSSLIQLCNESGWTIDELIKDNLEKIKSRTLQYKSLGRKLKVAIFGGAFNPITLGHIQTAQFVLNTSREFDEVWLMPSFKHMYNKNMVSPEHRLNMCEIASKVDGRIKVFPYEIDNQLSGSTYNFVKRLKEEKKLTEKHNFSLIIGMDNANTFDKWVNYNELDRLIQFVVIPRTGIKRDESVNWYLNYPHIYLKDENKILEVSSTLVRKELEVFYDTNGKNYKLLLKYLDKNVLEYIINNKLYLD